MTTPVSSGVGELEVRTFEGIEGLGERAWSGLCSAETPPFLTYPWLAALEETRTATPDKGWMPLYLGVFQEQALVGAVPAYVKGHSDGEFIFDHAWARYAYESLGIEYYPKLLVAVPFTPATGPRVLLRPGVDREHVVASVARALEALVERLEVSSAHVLFLTQGESEIFERVGWARRLGVQFHWHNSGYRSFDGFLERFSSKRRNQIRRELRELERQGTRLEVLSGGDLDSSAAGLAYDFYRSTVDKYFWGRRYLNREFFERVCQTMPERLHVVVARDAVSGKPVGGAFNLLGSRALYGRYWGATEERRCLHFNVCFYKGIMECVERGLDVFEPGAGGEHKLARGFEPTRVHSVHYLKDPRLDRVVRDFLARERDAIERQLRDAARESALRPLGV